METIEFRLGQVDDMPLIPVEGARLHRTVDGAPNAPPLILSNSLSSDLSMWDRQVERWSRRFRVIRYDQRGHGASSTPEGESSMEMLGGDVLAPMDHLAIQRADWCGISMGGMTGMWLALHAPARMGRKDRRHGGACNPHGRALVSRRIPRLCA